MQVNDRTITVRNARDMAENVKVSVLIDVDAIARALGPKAYLSKSGKSKALHGAIIVTHGPQK